MKLVIVNDVVFEYASGNPQRVGGAERQQWILARSLVAIGWAVTIGVRQTLAKGDHVVIEGVKFVGMGCKNFLWSCYRFLLAERPDWWYWRAAEHLWGPAVQVAKFAKVRTIYAVAYDTDVFPRQALSRRTQLWPLYAWGLMRADRIFVQHSQQLLGLPSSWQAKAYIVPSFAGEIPISSSHKERGNYVAWVAVLRRPKRADRLIEIAKTLPGIQFVVCGGQTRHRSSMEYGNKIVKTLYSLSNVKFLGKVSPQQAQQVIADSGIFLSTSEEEGFPNTFLEAWGSGTPVVSVTIDPDGIIQKKGLGRVSGTLEQAGKDIQVLMGSPALRDEIGARGKKYVAERHGNRAVTQIILQALSNEPSG